MRHEGQRYSEETWTHPTVWKWHWLCISQQCLGFVYIAHKIIMEFLGSNLWIILSEVSTVPYLVDVHNILYMFLTIALKYVQEQLGIVH